MYPTIISPAQAVAFATLMGGEDIAQAWRRGESRRARQTRHAVRRRSAAASRRASSRAAEL